MSYTKESLKPILDIISPLVRSIEFVGRIALCGSSDHDVDILIELEEPIDSISKTDPEMNEYILEKLLEIVNAIGEKEGTHYATIWLPTGDIVWTGYKTKVADQVVLVNICFTTPDAIPLDLFWTMGKTALNSINHDYFADKVKWRIEGDCP